MTHPSFYGYEAGNVEISCDERTPLLIDGEHAGWLPAALSIDPRGLTVLGSGEPLPTISSGGRAARDGKVIDGSREADHDARGDSQ
jgi:hypothetical protein